MDDEGVDQIGGVDPVICAWTIRACTRGDEEGQYQFGGVAKADVEQPAERLSARSASGGAAKPICEDRDGGGTNKEDPGGRRGQHL
jgi:hypothetical protein